MAQRRAFLPDGNAPSHPRLSARRLDRSGGRSEVFYHKFFSLYRGNTRREDRLTRFLPPEAGGSARPSKKAKPFPTGEAAASCAHSLSAYGGQLAHCSAEKCFPRRTCRRGKRILFFLRLRARTLRGFSTSPRFLPPEAGGSADKISQFRTRPFPAPHILQNTRYKMQGAGPLRLTRGPAPARPA